MRIIKIENITLDHGMWIEESNSSNDVTTETLDNLDGGLIIFEQPVRTSKKYVTLLSKNDAWQKKTTVDALLALANGSIGTTYTAYDDDGGSYAVRFRHEEKEGAVQFERLIDAKLSEWYSGVIYLGKV